MQIKYMLISIFLLNLPSNAQDLSHIGLCTNTSGNYSTIHELACHTEPALLKALNPGLNIPKCSEKGKPIVVAGHKPVSGVFVTCNRKVPNTRNLGTTNSCYNIANGLIEHGNGATVNIIVSQESLRDKSIQKNLELLVTKATKLNRKLNIIPVSLDATPYTRDNSHFRTKGETTELTSMISLTNSSYNEPVMLEVARSCGYTYDRSYRDIAKFDSAYSMLFSTATPISKGRAHNNAIIELINKRAKKNSGIDKKSEGGNSIGLPGGTIVFGKSNENKVRQEAAREVVKFFSRNQKVKEFTIPKVGAGHIDEFFNIVPDKKNPCGFALLVASPKSMIKYLKSQDQDKIFATHFDPSAFDTYMPEYKGKKRAINTIRSVKNYLNDSKFINSAIKIESILQKTKSKILDEIDNSLRAKCNPKVVKIPVAWTNMKEPLLPNPVNGLAVNGSYFFSKSQNKHRSDLEDKGLVHNLNYENHIKGLIKEVGLNAIPIDTSEYDQGGGNFHCATKNIYLPCIKKK